MAMIAYISSKHNLINLSQAIVMAIHTNLQALMTLVE